MFAKAPKDYIDPRLSRYDHVIVHAAATTATMVYVDAAWIDKVHRARGFSGAGYHAFITREGEWQDHDGGFPMRPFGVQGAHVGDCGAGWNGRSFGICLAGGINSKGLPENNFTPTQSQTLSDGIQKFLEKHSNPREVEVMGHRDLIKQTGAPPKACPCFDVKPWWYEVSGFGSSQVTGDPLRIPDYHRVMVGDTLWSISRLYGISIEEIKERNKLESNTLQIGWRLTL